jgi:RNA-directed DNA polymerase
MLAHRILVRSLLAGPLTREECRARAGQTLGAADQWLDPFIDRFVARFTTRPRLRTALEFLWADATVPRRLPIVQCLPSAPQVLPVWPTPNVSTLTELAAFLGITAGELTWFTRLRGASHYHLQSIPKRSGGVRQLAVPKPRLKAIQREILAELLSTVPLHSAAHGFCRGRSIHTFIAPHVQPAALLRLDLADFFPSLRFPRVAAFFRTAGYPEPVADALAALCTHEGSLPQGAPTSPALANALAYRLDCRLAGLARSAGLQYTRYADDLAFSGPTLTRTFLPHAAAIVLEEGFVPNYRKTRLMFPEQRQHLTGLTLNQKPNLARPDYDLLKATLTNCVRHGARTQNRDGHPAFREHLLGRVAHATAVNPSKGARLRAIFDVITWPEGR